MSEGHQKISCGVIPLRKKGSEWEVLILRCFKNWDFPKGMKEKDEDPLDCARREFAEETGLPDIEIASKDLFTETGLYNHGKIARYYVGIVHGEDEVKIIPNPVTGILEHHEYRWLKLEDAEDLLVPRLKIVLKWVQDQRSLK
jgi:8-oxo-dGTP pyrophosphatase MutT (NUDIX family)